MLDRSEISSVPLQAGTDDDVVTWSLGGGGSSCVQAAYHWNNSTPLAVATHNTLRIQDSYMFRHVAAQRGEVAATVPARHIFTSLPLCLTALALHKQDRHHAQACEAQKQSRRGSAVHFMDL